MEKEIRGIYGSQKTEKIMYLSNGNQKVKAVIFNLPAVETCKKSLECHAFCYAKKAENLYPQVLPCRTNNLQSTKENSFVSNMVDKLKRKRNPVVRIHESGDFYSKKYIQDWFDIMNQLPEKRFFAYTKRDDLFKGTLLKNKPSNLTLIYSMDGIQENHKPKIPKGFDSVALVTKDKTNCPAQLKKGITCVKDCSKCLKPNQTIVFKKH